MKRETLKIIINKYQGIDLAEHIASKVEEEKRIKKIVAECNKNLHNEDKRHQEVVASIKSKLAEVQQQCEHMEITYHGDPSGGNDGFYTCDLCGKEL